MKRIEESRRKQSLSELQRKAKKARRRDHIWTAEELDAAHAEAKELSKLFGIAEWQPEQK